MLSLDRRMSFEVEFNQVAIAVAQMLAREMDDAFLYLIDGLAADDRGPAHRSAEAANRIVVLSRRLIEEVRCYERWDKLRRDEQEQKPDEDNTPF